MIDLDESVVFYFSASLAVRTEVVFQLEFALLLIRSKHKFSKPPRQINRSTQTVLVAAAK